MKNQRKKTIMQNLLFLCCFLFVSSSLTAESGSLAAVNLLLLGKNCTGNKQCFAVTAGQETVEGGTKTYYDIYTKIGDGSPLYLTSVHAAGYKNSNKSGYLFSFFPEDSVQYKFQAIAADSKGLEGIPSDWSAPYSMYYSKNIRKTASSPVADPGLPQIVTIGTEVFLDGSASYDPATGTGTQLSYRWECYRSSAVVSISGLNTAAPKFTPSESGSYFFRLVVSSDNEDGTIRESGVRYVQIQAVDNIADALKANAGVPLQVAIGSKIVLDGSLSLPSSTDGGLYHWELLNKEQLETTVQINNATVPVASFLPDKTGTHVFRLTVMDDEAYTYQLLTVSVYDGAKVGALVEQRIANACEINCHIADINSDSTIDALDLALVTGAAGFGRGEIQFLAAADFDRNLQINANDIDVVKKCMGRPVTNPTNQKSF